jgi:hypothetical protein
MESTGTVAVDAQEGVATLQGGTRPRTCKRCEKPLTGRQTTFCSRGAGGCSGKDWAERHPRVALVPEGRKGPLLPAILGVMADGQWYTALQLAEKVRAFPHSCGNARRAHKYRLVLNAQQAEAR